MSIDFSQPKSAAKDKKKKPKGDDEASSSSSEDEETEAVSSEDAYMFPVFGSASLLGLYVVYKYLGSTYIDYFFTAYFGVFGVLAVAKLGAEAVQGVLPMRLRGYHLTLTKLGKGKHGCCSSLLSGCA